MNIADQRWKEFAKLNNIGSLYEKSSFDSEEDMDPYLKNICLEWCLKKPTSSLFLEGKTGVGKTYIMFCMIRKLFCFLPISEVRFFNSDRMNSRFEEETMKWGKCDHLIDQFSDVMIFMIDDLGTEDDKKRMRGNYEKLIESRIAHEKVTVISSNLDEFDLESKFGKRTSSRILTYKWITLGGEDRRSINRTPLITP